MKNHRNLAIIVAALLFVFALSACREQELKIAETSIPENSEHKSGAIENAESYLIDTDRSTCFSGVGYDSYLDDLYVKFRESGKIYVYENVPQDVYDSLVNADSMGGYYNKEIKGYYYCNGPL